VAWWIDTLLPVHLLDLVAEVLLGGPDAVDVEDLLRVARGLGVTGQLLAGGDLGAVHDAGGEVGPHRHRVELLGAVVGHDGEGPLALLVLADAHDTRGLREERGTLGRTGLEELDHTRQTVRDVLTRDTTGVEGPWSARAGLTDHRAAMMPTARSGRRACRVASIVP
jgi:hypothetical protein